MVDWSLGVWMSDVWWGMGSSCIDSRILSLVSFPPAESIMQPAPPPHCLLDIQVSKQSADQTDVLADYLFDHIESVIALKTDFYREKIDLNCKYCMKHNLD